MASIAVGGGPTIATAGFAGHYVLQATQNLRWKQFPKAYQNLSSVVGSTEQGVNLKCQNRRQY